MKDPETEKIGAPQMLHRTRVNLNHALQETAGWVRWYFACRASPAPAFSGGTWDSWPGWAVDVWRICSSEENALKAWVRAEAEGQRG